MADNNSMNFGVDLLPVDTNIYYLGNNSKRWKLYATEINGKDILTNNIATTHDVATKIEFIRSTQTGTTASWTGNTLDTELYDGKIIVYRLGQTSKSTVTLNLTFPDGTTSGAKPVYRYGESTRIGTHFAAGSMIFMVYDGVNERWNCSAYYDSNSNTYVTQTASTLVNDWRAVLTTYNSAVTGTDIASGTTNISYYSQGVKIQPATGKLSATEFIGSGASLTLLNASNVASGTLATGYGGTGLTAYAKGDILYASAENTLSALNGNTTTTAKYLKSVGASNAATAPVWAQIAASEISGLGTMATASADSYIAKSTLSGAYNIMYSSAANTPTRLAANTTTTRKFLRMTGTGSAGAAPAWDTLTVNDIPSLSTLYKPVQTAVSDPTASSTTSNTFIDSISQDANGVITVTKKTVPVTSITDDKVLQEYKAYSSYTYWRPLLIGESNNSSETGTFSDQTAGCYTFSNIRVQPSTGTLKATLFKGSGASLTSLDASNVSSGTLAVARGGTGVATASANTVFAGPTSGDAAAPAFRALGATDIPMLTLSKISDAGTAAGKGVTDNSSNADVTSSDTNLITGRTLYYQLAKKGYTTNTGTVTSVATGAGLTGGTITTSGTIKANLTSDTALTNAAQSVTESATRVYPVRIDKNSKLAVVVPWTDTNTLVNYSLAATTKAYLMASSNAPTSTKTAREAVGDTGVYLTATSGELSSLRYSWHDTSSTPVEKAYTVWNSTDLSIDFVFN